MNSVAKINLSHLRKNIASIRYHIGAKTFLCPMIKANAYGHGVEEVSRTIDAMDIDAVGVVTLEEGCEVRERVDPTNPILVFSNFSKSDLETCIELKLTPVISEWETLKAAAEVSKSHALQVHLKFNSGMNRQGFEVADSKKVRELIDDCQISIVGVATHFAKGEDINSTNGFTRKQLERFQSVIDTFGATQNYHVHNSASMIRTKDFSFGVRPGISIYGAYPDTHLSEQISLHPVMSLRSPMVMIRDIQSGEIVSYGGTWKAKRNSRVAVIPLGYADGLRRGLSNKLSFSLNGQRAPQVGTICMDYCMVDVTDINEPAIGQEVTIFGWDREDANVSTVSSQIDSIPYEILTGIGARVKREFLHAEN